MLWSVLASAFAVTGVAHAQDDAEVVLQDAPGQTALAGDGDRIVYEAAFFAQFNPRNALDMVQQTPGFSLDEGEDRRGLSGAVGNLLIDGVRQRSKSQSLSSILSRIPADQVTRFEILRGASVAGDASGQALLLNVVRIPSASGGVWELGAEYGARPIIAPRAEAALSGRYGLLEYGLGATINSEFDANTGERRSFNAAGALTREADFIVQSDEEGWSLNGEATHPFAGGRLSGNAQFESERGASKDWLTFTDGAGALLSTFSSQENEEETEFELGFNYQRNFGRWEIELLGLVNRAREESAEIATRREALGAITEATTQNERSDTGEAILHATIGRQFATHRIAFGAEGAFNSLEQTSVVTEDTGAGPAPVTVPNANVLVEEERADLFAVHTWNPDDNWSLETRLGWETSTLTFTGDANQSFDLSFWKPSLQVTRTLGDNQLRLRIYRDVGQLNFGDFVSSVSISDDMINGGNPDLQPETSWDAEFGADLRVPGGVALGLSLTHTRFSDVIDEVLIVPPGDDPFEALGNIGDAEQTQFNLDATLPLDAALPGARLTVEGYLRQSEVTDPLTGETRSISRRPESSVEVSFRHDIESMDFAWSASLSKDGESRAYQADEVDTSENGLRLSAFVETSALPNSMRVRLSLEDIVQSESQRTRRFSVPDRLGLPDGRELRGARTANAPWITFELAGSF